MNNLKPAVVELVKARKELQYILSRVTWAIDVLEAASYPWSNKLDDIKAVLSIIQTAQLLERPMRISVAFGRIEQLLLHCCNVEKRV